MLIYYQRPNKIKLYKKLCVHTRLPHSAIYKFIIYTHHSHYSHSNTNFIDHSCIIIILFYLLLIAFIKLSILNKYVYTNTYEQEFIHHRWFVSASKFHTRLSWNININLDNSIMKKKEAHTQLLLQQKKIRMRSWETKQQSFLNTSSI